MQQGSMQRSIEQLSGLPTVQGELTRLAADRVRKAGIKLEPLLSRMGLNIEQINDHERRINASSQIAFLKAAAEALNDDLLGFHLAEEFDLRDLGLLYYVVSSSDTLGDAMKRASRYSRITNEAVVLKYQEAREPRLRLSYSGIPRHADFHQVEFCIVAMVRVARVVTGRRFFPNRVSISHARPDIPAKLGGFLGKSLEFGGDADEIEFPKGSAEWPLVGADAKLNKILLKVCDESLRSRKSATGKLRIAVENAILPLLPHGQAKATAIAERLGMSERTLVRRLAEKGLTFNEILQELKASLALRYLEEHGMPVSRVAWLLGYEDTSSFSHACRRWTGRSPRQFRPSS
jgi:AraC-like DNA-binding protein